MASLLAFFIGAITVFYTMRFSVESRSREFALLMCLGEDRKNVALSLLLETAVLGILGTFLGLLAAFPASFLLLKMGISTTGRIPVSGFTIPEIELYIITAVSISIALLGVIAPIRDLYRFQISSILQPRFVAGEISQSAFKLGGLSWLISPMLLASYLVIRPFLESWLTVVYFFLFEAIFVVILTLVTLWWTRPFLRLSVRLIELLTKSIMPLESLLTVRRIRLSSEKYVFSIIGIVLVFSLLTSLHAITRTLKDEIYTWSSEAITPYFYYKRNHSVALDEARLAQIRKQNEIYLFRYSTKTQGAMPFRVIDLNDINRYRLAMGKAPFAKQQVIFSRTLAARFGAEEGDYLLLATENTQHYFKIIEISDELGTLAEDGQYIDIKSY
ncbi:MAG: ABC transporter permease, partial [Methyloprofundus sp.]|nr:ABC transporter permease [Methyloprofundus sp.]